MKSFDWRHFFGGMVGVLVFMWHALRVLSKLGLTGNSYKGNKMQLSKAFDPQALIQALKDKGIKDAEQLVNDELPVIFDWLNSSVAMVTPAPYGGVAVSILQELEAKAQAEVLALEASVEKKV